MLTWVKDSRPYSTGEKCLLNGKWNVGGVHWAATSKEDSAAPYVATCTLPGIKDVLGRYATPDEAKARVERSVAYWIKNSGLEANK